MSDMPNIPQAVPGTMVANNPPASTPAASSDKLIKRPFRWYANGLNDWIILLGKPEPGGIFQQPPDFKWACLLRLIVVVLSFSGAILGVTLIKFNGGLSEIPFQKWPAVVLVLGALLTIGYYALASVFRVPISVRNALFTILLLSLPWLPFLPLIYFLVKTLPKSLLPPVGIMLFLASWTIPVLLTRNLCSGVKVTVPEVSAWRVNCSVIAWVGLLIGGFVLTLVFVSMPNP